MKRKTYRSRFEIEVTELDVEKTFQCLKEQVERDRIVALDRCRQLQGTVYIMCGGGFLGRMAAEQPVDFYVDDRCQTPVPTQCV